MKLSEKQIEYYKLERALNDLAVEDILDKKQEQAIKDKQKEKTTPGNSERKSKKAKNKIWLQCDESGNIWSNDKLLPEGEDLVDLNDKIAKLKERVKEKPDEETLFFWRQQHPMVQIDENDLNRLERLVKDILEQ